MEESYVHQDDHNEKLQVLQESHGGRSSPNGDALEGVSPLDCAKELEGIPLSALLLRCHAAAVSLLLQLVLSRVLRGHKSSCCSDGSSLQQGPETERLQQF